MNWLDIVLAIILILAAIDGYRKGIILQTAGIIGLLLGIILGIRFSTALAGWLNLGAAFAPILSFVIILLVTILAMWIVGNVVRKVFRLTGFGIVDRVGGIALGIIKIGLITCLLLGLFVNFNRTAKWVNPEVFSKSLLYKPLDRMSKAIFPYIIRATNGIFSAPPESRGPVAEPPKHGETYNI